MHSVKAAIRHILEETTCQKVSLVCAPKIALIADDIFKKSFEKVDKKFCPSKLLPFKPGGDQPLWLLIHSTFRVVSL